MPNVMRMCTWSAVTGLLVWSSVVGAQATAAPVPKVLAYRGIRYAAPPVGALRWMPPQPVRASAPPAPGGAFGARCIQFRTDASPASTPDSVPESEDCLFLNVYAIPHVDGSLPVLVWIHGGGNVQGSGSGRFYDGTALATQGVVVVTLNYRLGTLGFFAHPQLNTRSVNFALLDQLAALRWVQAHIASFGGDPGRVTVAGESSGAGSVLNLVASPDAKGLFAGAIVESGGEGGDRTLESARESGTVLANCVTHGAPDPIAALRALPADAYRDSVRRCADASPFDPGPIIDSQVVLDSPRLRFAEGKDLAVPMLIGTNSDEGSLLGRGSPWLDSLGQHIGETEVARLDSLYAPGSTPRVLHEVWGDLWFSGPARAMARHRSAHGHPTWVYYYTYQRERQRVRTIGAPHGAEIPMVFRLFDLPAFAALFSPADSAVGARVNGYWLAFIRRGDPGWPVYRRPTDTVMELSDTAKAIDQYRAAQLDEVDGLRP
jgi:para-nitrobenzyl esterase